MDLDAVLTELNRINAASYDLGTEEIHELDPLEALEAVLEVSSAADRLLALLVAAARPDHSWAEIGTALGVTRQSAHARFGRLIRTLPSAASGAGGVTQVPTSQEPAAPPRAEAPRVYPTDAVPTAALSRQQRRALARQRRK